MIHAWLFFITLGVQSIRTSSWKVYSDEIVKLLIALRSSVLYNLY